MKKKIVAWALGSAVFAGIAGFWAWNLPSLLSGATRPDPGLRDIMSAIQGDEASLGADLRSLQDTLDQHAAQWSEQMGRSAEEARAIQNLKDKILDQADGNQNLNANLNVPPDADSNANLNSPR
jgi:hypothetical protein